MTTPPSDDSVSKLFLTDTFYSWFVRTNEIVDKINPITLYGISADTDTGYQGITIENMGEGFHKIGYALPHVVNEDLGTTHVFQNWVNFEGGISGAVINTINGNTGDVYVVQSVSGRTSDLVSGNVERAVFSVNGFTGTTAGVVTIPGLITATVSGQKGRILVVNEGGTFDTINFVSDWPADGDEADQASTVLQKAFRVNTGTAAAGILVSGSQAGGRGSVNYDYNTNSNAYYGYPGSVGTIVNIPWDTEYNNNRISLHTGSNWSMAPDIHMPGNSLIASGAHLSIRAATRAHTKAWDETEDSSALGTPRHINIITDPRLKYNDLDWGVLNQGNVEDDGTIICRFTRTSVLIGLVDYLNNPHHSFSTIQKYNMNSSGVAEDPTGAPLTVFAGPQAASEYDGDNMPTMILMHARSGLAVGCMKIYARDNKDMTSANTIEAIGHHGLAFSVGKTADPGNMAMWQPRIVSAFKDDGSLEMGYIAGNGGIMTFRRDDAQAEGRDTYNYPAGRLFTKIYGAKGPGADMKNADGNAMPWHAGHIQTQGGFENFYHKSVLIDDYGSAPVNYFKLDTILNHIDVTHRNSRDLYQTDDVSFLEIRSEGGPGEGVVDFKPESDIYLGGKVQAREETGQSTELTPPVAGQVLVAADDEGHMRWEDKAFMFSVPLNWEGTLMDTLDVEFGSPWRHVYWAGRRGMDSAATILQGGGQGNASYPNYVTRVKYWVSSNRNYQSFKFNPHNGVQYFVGSGGSEIDDGGYRSVGSILHPNRDEIDQNRVTDPNAGTLHPIFGVSDGSDYSVPSYYLRYTHIGNVADEAGQDASDATKPGENWYDNGTHGCSSGSGYQYSNIVYQSLKACSEDHRYIYDDWCRFKNEYDARVAAGLDDPSATLTQAQASANGVSAGSLRDVFYSELPDGAIQYDCLGSIMSDNMIRIFASGGYAGFGLPRPTGIQSWAHGEGFTAGGGWNRPAYAEGMYGLNSEYRTDNGLLWSNHFVDGGWGLTPHTGWAMPSHGDIPTEFDEAAALSVEDPNRSDTTIDWDEEWNRTHTPRKDGSTKTQKGNIWNFFDHYNNGTGGFHNPLMPGSEHRMSDHDDSGTRQRSATHTYVYKLDYFKLFSNVVDPTNTYWSTYKDYSWSHLTSDWTGFGSLRANCHGPYDTNISTRSGGVGSVLAQQYKADRGYSSEQDFANDWNKLILVCSPYGVGGAAGDASLSNQGFIGNARAWVGNYRSQTGVMFENPYDAVGTFYESRSQNLAGNAPPGDGSKYSCQVDVDYMMPPGMKIKFWIKPLLIPEEPKIGVPSTWHYGTGPRLVETIGGDERIADAISFTLGQASAARDLGIVNGQGWCGSNSYNPWSYHPNSPDPPGGAGQGFRRWWHGSGTELFADGKIDCVNFNAQMSAAYEYPPLNSGYVHYALINNPLGIKAGNYSTWGWNLREAPCFDTTRDRIPIGVPEIDDHIGEAWASRYSDTCPTPFNKEQNHVPWLPLWDGSRFSLVTQNYTHKHDDGLGGFIKFAPDTNNDFGGTINWCEVTYSNGYYTNSNILKFAGSHPHYDTGTPCNEVVGGDVGSPGSGYMNNVVEYGPSTGESLSMPYFVVYDEDDNLTEDWQGHELTGGDRAVGSVKYVERRRWLTESLTAANQEGERFYGCRTYGSSQYTFGRVHADMSHALSSTMNIRGGMFSMGRAAVYWRGDTVQDVLDNDGIDLTGSWPPGGKQPYGIWSFKTPTREQPYQEVELDSTHVINGNANSKEHVIGSFSINVPIHANGKYFKMVSMIADMHVHTDYMFRKGVRNFSTDGDPIFPATEGGAWFEDDHISIRNPDAYIDGLPRTTESHRSVFNDIKWQCDEEVMKDGCVGRDHAKVLDGTHVNPCWWGGIPPEYYCPVIPDIHNPGFYNPSVEENFVLRFNAKQITLSR